MGGQFIYVIRKRIKLPPERAIFIFVNNVIPPTAHLMSTIYEEQKDEDGFLYITYSGAEIITPALLGAGAAVDLALNDTMPAFKQEHPLEQRKPETERLRAKYPDRIPVICEKSDRSDIPDIDKKKHLVPADLTVGQFIYVIRKRIKLPPEHDIFIFVNNVIAPTAHLMSTIYEEQKDEDGFLYITYSGAEIITPALLGAGAAVDLALNDTMPAFKQ